MSYLSEADLARLLARGDCRLVGETPPPVLAADTPEDRFLATVRQIARAQGFETYHTHDSRRSESGFCDLVLARPSSATSPGRLIFAELKSARGKLTAAQAVWLDVLRHTVPGVEVVVWRPADLVALTECLTRRLP